MDIINMVKTKRMESYIFNGNVALEHYKILYGNLGKTKSNIEQRPYGIGFY